VTVGPAAPEGADGPDGDGGSFTFDRHLVLEQLGGWRGMVDASLPTVAFIVANSIGGLTAGIWSAVAAAVLIFLLRLVRRQSVQQAVSGLFAVVVAVAIAAYSGHARDYFVLGILRNAAIGVVLAGSTLVRRPLVGVIAEFLAPSHLGAMSGHSLQLRGRFGRGASAPAAAKADRRQADPQPERHWREDRRMLRAYTWLTLLWSATFLARVVVQGPLYQRNEVGLLGTTSLLLGLPLTGVALVVTLWVVARLHRHRSPTPPAA
jgi:FtsH-binding integral membrane protein